MASGIVMVDTPPSKHTKQSGAVSATTPDSSVALTGASTVALTGAAEGARVATVPLDLDGAADGDDVETDAACVLLVVGEALGTSPPLSSLAGMMQDTSEKSSQRRPASRMGPGQQLSRPPGKSGHPEPPHLPHVPAQQALSRPVRPRPHQSVPGAVSARAIGGSEATGEGWATGAATGDSVDGDFVGTGVAAIVSVGASGAPVGDESGAAMGLSVGSRAC